MHQVYSWVVLSVIATSVLVGAVTGLGRAAWRPWRIFFPLTVVAVLVIQLGLGIFLVNASGTVAGSLAMFWIYAVVTIFISIGAGIWSYVDRTEFSSFISVVSGLTLVVMFSRMHGIWEDQVGSIQ